jgi:hypothetical protein
MILWDRDQAGAKDRYEADLRLDWEDLLFQAEYIRARDVGATGKATRAQGFYGALAYRLLDGRLEPCLRVGWLDPDVDADAGKDADESWQYSGGLNYYLQKHEAKLQLNYTRYQYDDATANNEVIFAVQVAL